MISFPVEIPSAILFHLNDQLSSSVPARQVLLRLYDPFSTEGIFLVHFDVEATIRNEIKELSGVVEELVHDRVGKKSESSVKEYLFSRKNIVSNPNADDSQQRIIRHHFHLRWADELEVLFGQADRCKWRDSAGRVPYRNQSALPFE
jgi:hypothetical protein